MQPQERTIAGSSSTVTRQRCDLGLNGLPTVSWGFSGDGKMRAMKTQDQWGNPIGVCVCVFLKTILSLDVNRYFRKLKNRKSSSLPFFVQAWF